MSRQQRLRRIATWRGSAITIALCTLWLLLSALGGSVTE